jgi:4-aminobutyrate aminotransferase-like enzyme
LRGRGKDEILAGRKRYLGPNLSISYEKPLKIIRGSGQFLYDEEGQVYLDCVNNVPHVGHSHPRVVEAARRQMAILNTNTRYLHDFLVEYAQALVGLLPDPLSTVYFVNSGSEANELALRMVRAHTRRQDVLVVDGAYHGNTTTMVELSPYKFDGPGGEGPRSWVHKVAMPDPYRGRYRALTDQETAADIPESPPGSGGSTPGSGGSTPDSGAVPEYVSVEEIGRRYAEEVRKTLHMLRAGGKAPAAFFCESMLGCGGQIVLPRGYLAEAFALVRKAGGVCVADEVQVGFGRAGSHFWAFETQGVVPDIVTLGKPMGNGHPIGAVITTSDIAESFMTGMEYFNTYGGNPVSCAVGLAVLDVIREEGLQENARKVGERLLEGLHKLKERFSLIGDVRGLGLYIGVELVVDREARTPATVEAARVKERLREHRILLSTDGPRANVLKIKPPLVFNPSDADRLVRTLGQVLEEDEFRG